MNNENDKFKAWLQGSHPHVKLLLDKGINIDGVNFFGGRMWTDFNARDAHAENGPESSQ